MPHNRRVVAASADCTTLAKQIHSRRRMKIVDAVMQTVSKNVRLRDVLLIITSMTVLVTVATGQEQHPLTDIPPPGDVMTSYVLPEHPSKQFPAGNLIPVLVGFHNDASYDLNVSYILGSINLPEDNMYVQNFSYYAYFQRVPGKTEFSFEYGFRPDKSLQPMELRVALTVFYEDSDQHMFASTFFNETIYIVEQPKLIDYEAIWMYMVLFALAAAAVYGVVSWLMGLVGGKKRPSKQPVKHTVDKSGDDNWLTGEPAVKHLKSK